MYVALDAKGKITATFYKQNAKEHSKQYLVREINGETHIEGTPPLTPSQEETAFNLLLTETQNASPFDSLENGKNIHNTVRELAPELKLKKKK